MLFGRQHDGLIPYLWNAGKRSDLTKHAVDVWSLKNDDQINVRRRQDFDFSRPPIRSRIGPKAFLKEKGIMPGFAEKSVNLAPFFPVPSRFGRHSWT